MVTRAAEALNNGYDCIGKIPLLNVPSIPLSPKIRAYIEECATLCLPKDIYICNGSDTEHAELLKLLERNKTIEPLPKYENWLVLHAACILINLIFVIFEGEQTKGTKKLFIVTVGWLERIQRT